MAFSGVSESAGHPMAFKILPDKSSNMIYWLITRPTGNYLVKNTCLKPLVILAVVKLK